MDIDWEDKQLSVQKKRERENGSLTLEATLTLTFTMFLILFLLNFGRVYQAQNFMRHSMLETSKMLSYFSFQYEMYPSRDSEDYNKVVNFMRQVKGAGTSIWHGNLDASALENAYKNGDCSQAAEIASRYGGAVNKDERNKQLLQYYITEIDYSESTFGSGDILLDASYTVTLSFPFFGYDKVTLHQQAKSAKWSK